MTFALLARDSLKVVHLRGGDRSSDDLEILDDGFLVARLIVDDEERQRLNVLELYKSKIDQIAVFQVLGSDFNLLNRSSAACRIKVQSHWLVDEELDSLGTVLGWPFEFERVNFDRLIESHINDQLLVDIRREVTRALV